MAVRCAYVFPLCSSQLGMSVNRSLQRYFLQSQVGPKKLLGQGEGNSPPAWASTVAWGLLNAYEVSNILLLQCKGPGVTQTLECLRRQQPAQKGAEKDMRLDCIEFHEK